MKKYKNTIIGFLVFFVIIGGFVGFRKHNQNKKRIEEEWRNGVNNIRELLLSIDAAGGIMHYNVKDGKHVLEYAKVNETELWWLIQSYNKENNRSHSYDEIYNVLFSNDELTGEIKLSWDRERSLEENLLRNKFIEDNNEEHREEIKAHLLTNFIDDYEIKNGTKEGAEEMFNSLSYKGLQKLVNLYGYGED